MRTDMRVWKRLATLVLAASLSTAAGCSGSSSRFSGHYEADLGDGTANLDFEGDNKVNVSLVSGKESLVHHCIYTISDNKMVITTDEPMGVPMHLIVDGDVLKDSSGLVYKKK